MSTRQADEAAALQSKIHQQNSNRFHRIFFQFMSGVVGGAINALGNPILTIVRHALWEGFVLSTIGTLRQWYLQSAANHYTPQTPEPRPTERAAFEYGTQAVSFLGYIKSFFHYSTWRHPRTFAAGLAHGTQKNHDVIDHLLGNTPKSKKRFVLKVTLLQQRTWMPFSTSLQHTQWIVYKDKKDFKKQLNLCLDNYKEQTAFYNRAATLILSTPALQITSDFDLNVKHLFTFTYSGLSEILHKNAFIKNIGTEDIIFHGEIQPQWTLSIQKAQQENRRRWMLDIGYTLLGALPMAAFSLYVSVPLAVVLSNTLFIGGIAAGLRYARQSYLDYCAQFYEDNDNTDPHAVPDSRKQAAEYGIQAATWPGYLLSFSPTRYQAYRHCIDFAGAMEQTVEQNTDLLRKMRL